jgi:hypothetical protein
MNEDLLMIKRLEALRGQHRDLDHKIDYDPMDEFSRQRLKKMRLEVRTEIARLEQVVYPDIIA